jgi:molecular chaperone DnaK
MAQTTSKIIGIDLGTTNSCVATLEGEDPIVLPNAEGSRTTPSVVAVTESGDRLVGHVAKRQMVTNPEHTVYAVKRLIGRKLQDSQVKRHQSAVPYQVVTAANGDAWVRMRGKDYSPAEVSSFVLAKLKKTAEDYLGEEITEAVVTVPAYFDDAQRQATKDAGRIAGLNVQRIINEPTAAALAYGSREGAPSARAERVVVYDLGGGTFDVSILRRSDGVYEVVATSGDTFLGGEDFDRRIIDHLAEEFKKATGLDLRQDKMALQRLKEAAEKAKHELSSTLTTDVNLPFIAADASGPRHLEQTLSRGKLEKLTDDLVTATLVPIENALRDARLKPGEIDNVILVGGQTRMPRVQERVAEFFGKRAQRGVNPDEVVAAGAAIQGGVLKGSVTQVLLLDVTPLSLGVETAGGITHRLIPRNTTIPTRQTEVFSTAQANQDFVNVHVLQGERDMAKDNKSLARFQLVGIPPAPRGVPQIEVAFDIDANGILSVSARDLGTQKQQTVAVTPTSGLTEQEITRLIEEAANSADADRTKREVAELRNQATALVYTTERALEEFKSLLKSEDATLIGRDLTVCRKALDAIEAAGAAGLEEAGVGSLREAYTQLERSSATIAELLYGTKGG